MKAQQSRCVRGLSDGEQIWWVKKTEVWTKWFAEKDDSFGKYGLMIRKIYVVQNYWEIYVLNLW